jgi:[protein-PII] uridylyltransferase
MAASVPEDLPSFYASMPWRYRVRFDGHAVSEHATIVARRRGLTAHVEVWRPLAGGGAIVCAVAEDRPGLLSLVSAALVESALDVTAAQCYTRTPSKGGAEAVDLLWLRHDPAVEPATPVRAEHAARVGESLRSLLAGSAGSDSGTHALSPAAAPFPADPLTRVVLTEGLAPSTLVLTVETADRPGLLLAITHALFLAGVQILDSDASTRGGRAHDRFTIAQVDAARVTAARREEVRRRVLDAVSTLRPRAALRKTRLEEPAERKAG